MTELQNQINIFKWSRQPSIREKWPELALLHHIKNETAEGTRKVAIDRAQGVKAGVPDINLPIARGQYHSLYIELKTEKGKTSPKQDWWIGALKKQGNYACVCRGWADAIKVITDYLEGRL